MNWTLLLILSLLFSSGLALSSFAMVGQRKGWAVGLFFRTKSCQIIGLVVYLAAAVLSFVHLGWKQGLLVILFGFIINAAIFLLFGKAGGLLAFCTLLVSATLYLIFRLG